MAGMGAFWKFGLVTTSNIDTILNKKDFTLEELLDDEDLLQECRQGTKDKLTEYLAKPEQIKALLEYVINEPSEEIDERQRFKYSNIASEVLTSECWAIMDALCQPESLDLLFSTLDKPQPLNPLLTSLFSKVVTMLMQKEIAVLTKYILGHEDIPDKLISHLATPAIKDIVFKMTTVELLDNNETNLEQYWSQKAKLISILIGLFNTSQTGASDAVLLNITELMEDLINEGRKEAIEMQEFSNPLPFLKQIINEDTLKELLGYMFDTANSPMALKCGLDIINIILTEPERGEDEAPPTAMDKTRHSQEIGRVMIALIPFVGKIDALLHIEPSPLMTASGPLNPPLGAIRLNGVRTVEALVSAQNDGVDDELIQMKALPLLLDLFARYTENNFLHAYILTIVSSIVNNPPRAEATRKAPLHEHLFKECDIVGRCITLFKTGTTHERLRLGYMGHVIKMCNCLQASCGKEGDAFKLYFGEGAEGDAATKAEEWAAFVKGTLTAANDQQSSTYEHRPPMNSGFSSEECSDDEYDGTDEMMANATLQYGRYLSERIAVEIPDSYGVDDEESDDEDKADVAETYGRTGPFEANINYSTDINIAPSAIDTWKIVDDNGDVLGKIDVPPQANALANTTIVLATDEDSDGGDKPHEEDASKSSSEDPFATVSFGNSTVSAEDPFADTASTTIAGQDPFADDDNNDNGVAIEPLQLRDTIAFDKVVDTSTPTDPNSGWAPFGETQPIATAVADDLVSNVMSHVSAMDITTSTEIEQEEDTELEDPLPELPEETTPSTSPSKRMLVIDGTTDNIETESSTDTVDNTNGHKTMEIEGGGHLFGSAV